MSKVKAVGLDVVTENSGHQCVGMAVSVCLTPAAPSPLPIPYPTVGTVSEGLIDPAMRTKVNGKPVATVGSCLKTCHGNEPGTLKEVVSLNTAGPSPPLMGAPNVFIELGMAAVTGSPALMNKAVTAGAGAKASDAGGAGGGPGGGGGGGGGAGGPAGPAGPAGGGGSGGSGSHRGAAAPGKSSAPKDEHTCQNGHPVDVLSGHVVDQATDLTLPGAIPLVWKRYYSSARRADRNATLGPGWAHGFEARLTVEGRLVTLREGEGRSVWFAALAPGERFFHRRERLTLIRDEADQYRVVSLDTRETMVFAAARPGGPYLLRRIEDAHGNALRLDYEGDTLTQIVDTAGRVLTLRWQGGRIVRLEVRAGGALHQWVDYQYDAQGRLCAALDALGHADRYAYDGKGRMTAAVVKNGTRFTYAYDPASGRCVRTGGPGGLYEVAFRHEAASPSVGPEGASPTVVTESAEPRIYRGNALGLMTRASLPDGTLLEEVAYDDEGYLLAEANGAGEGTQYWYDERGHRVRVLDANRNETRFDYADDRLVRRVDPEGVVTDYAYDGKGNLVGAHSSQGRWLALAYDAFGRLVRVDDDAGRARSFTYDAQHNLVAETDAADAMTRYAYDALGRPVARTDALGRVTRVTYDRLGQRTSLRTPDGALWQWAYDPMGKVTRETDPAGRTTRFENAGMGVPVGMTTPDGQAWAFAYTPFERLASVTNPRGETYAFAYDGAGRVVRETTFDGRTLAYHYSAAGRIERLDYPDRTTRAFAYDRLGHVTGDATGDGTVTLRRDRQGRLVEALLDEAGERTTTRFERDERGRVVAEHQGEAVVRYGYDATGRLVERVLPGGLRTRYAFDARDALTEVEHAGFALRFERDAFGREVRRGTDAYGIESRYDAADRLLEQDVRVPAPGGGLPSAVVRRRWHYDASGLVTQIDDARWGSTFYRYGRAGELLEARRGALREVFAYDDAGSLRALTSRLGDGAPSSEAPRFAWGTPDGDAQAWERAPGNLLRSTMAARYRYDARARRVGKRAFEGETAGGEGRETLYVWDERDRLREVRLPDGRRVAYGYDALGRRVRKRVEGADGAVTREQRFVWDGNALALELDSSRGRRSFVHWPGSLEPLLHEEQGEVFAYVTDQVGVPRELVDAAGRVAWAASLTAFGRVVEEQRDEARGGRVESPFRLLGQVYDEESGLSWTRFRCFDAETGRWLSADPLGLEGGLELIGFDGNPTSCMDPLGLASKKGNPHRNLSDPNPIPKAIREQYEEIQLRNHGGTGGTPGSNPVTRRQTIFQANEMRHARRRDASQWAGSKEWDVPGTSHRILERPDGKLGYVLNHDYSSPFLFPAPWYSEGGKVPDRL